MSTPIAMGVDDFIKFLSTYNLPVSYYRGVLSIYLNDVEQPFVFYFNEGTGEISYYDSLDHDPVFTVGRVRAEFIIPELRLLAELDFPATRRNTSMEEDEHDQLYRQVIMGRLARLDPEFDNEVRTRHRINQLDPEFKSHSYWKAAFRDLDLEFINPKERPHA